MTRVRARQPSPHPRAPAEVIKLDRLLGTDIDTDPARVTLASALVQFSEDTGAQLIAEGFETSEECSSHPSA